MAYGAAELHRLHFHPLRMFDHHSATFFTGICTTDPNG